jgi:hypothetical protein
VLVILVFNLLAGLALPGEVSRSRETKVRRSDLSHRVCQLKIAQMFCFSTLHFFSLEMIDVHKETMKYRLN